MHGFEARLMELAGDVLTALGRGEIAPDAPIVRATATALAELRRAPEPAPAAAGPGSAKPAAGAAGRGPRTVRTAPPAVEQLLGVAARMREDRRSFAAACAAVAEEAGTSAQAVRNACTRWLGVAAAEWQPLLIDGAEAGVLALASRVAERCPWLVDRVSRDFGVSAVELRVGTPSAR